MTPDTVHRLAMEIRHLRGLLTADQMYLSRQPVDAQQTSEGFKRLTFWRDVLKFAEQKLAKTPAQHADRRSEEVFSRQ